MSLLSILDFITQFLKINELLNLKLTNKYINISIKNIFVNVFDETTTTIGNILNERYCIDHIHSGQLILYSSYNLKKFYNYKSLMIGNIKINEFENIDININHLMIDFCDYENMEMSDIIKLHFLFLKKLKLFNLSIPLIFPIIKNLLPESLLILTLNNYDCEIDDNVLPKNLQILKFYNFNKIIKTNTLPKNLKQLIFGITFNSKIEYDALPDSLEYINFNNSYNQDIHEIKLPGMLKFLNFGSSYDRDLQNYIFPNKLNELYLPRYYKFLNITDFFLHQKFNGPISNKYLRIR